MTSLLLRRMVLSDEADVTAAVRELEAEGGHWSYRYRGDLPWPDYLSLVLGWEDGVDLPDDFVPHAELVADVDGVVVGRASIRFELNEFLQTLGGHIGYTVRPAFRGRGYAKEILAQSLTILRARGTSPILVTCDDDNLASAAVIESHGGRLETVVMGELGKLKRRYWL